MIGSLALAAVLLLSWLLLGTDVLGGEDGDPDRSTAAAEDPTGDTSDGASQEPSGEPSDDASQEAPEASAKAMQAFVEDYLATVTSDPAAAWERLTPEFQQASGGFGGYKGYWSTIDSAEPSGIQADPER